MTRKRIGLYLLILVFLLSACGKQAAEEPFDTTTQPTTQATESTDDGMVTQPQEPVKPSDGNTEPTEGTTPPVVTEPTEGTKPTEPTQGTNPTPPTEDTEPPVITEPTDPTDETEPEPTEPSEETAPPEATEPTQPTLLPGLGDDELPLVPVG